jgi:hypothetical protein
MADLGGALEYLVGLQDLVANFEAEDEGSADVPGAFFEQPATPPEPELPPSQVPGEPDEPSLPDDGVSTEDSDDEVQARLEDDWWKGWLKRFHEFKKGGGKVKGSHKGSDKGSHKGSVSQCGSKAKAAAKVQIMPSSSEKSLEASRPWRNKQQKIGEPSPPPFPPPDFAGGAYVVGAPHGGRPVPQGFPPGMQAPPPPPGYVEPLPYASTRQACLVPPPPPPAVLPSQHVVRPSSKSKVM